MAQPKLDFKVFTCDADDLQDRLNSLAGTWMNYEVIAVNTFIVRTKKRSRTFKVQLEPSGYQDKARSQIVMRRKADAPVRGSLAERRRVLGG